MSTETRQGKRKSRLAFGSVVKVKNRDKRLLSYGVRWTQDNKRHFRSGFPTKELADAFRAAKQVESCTAKITGQPLATPTTMSRLVEAYVAWTKGAGGLAPATSKNAAKAMAPVVAKFGDRVVDEIRPREWIALADEVGAELKPTTWNLYRGYWSVVLRWGMKRGMCAIDHVGVGDSPAVARREGPARTPPFLSREALSQLYGAMPVGKYRAATILLGELGLRLREATEMDWGEIAPDWSTFTLPDARAKGGKGRALLIPPRAQVALREQASARPGGSPPAAGRVFDFHTTQFSCEFRKGADGAGMTTLTPHGLRHSFASNLAALGAPPAAIQQVLGHAQLATTMIYMRHAPLDAAKQAMALYAKSAPAEEE